MKYVSLARWIAAICIIVGTWMVLSIMFTPKSISTDYRVVAHRGFSAIAPENTLIAYDKAIKAGANGCECDVYRTADNELVLMHDGTIDRTTNGRGIITHCTWAELKTLDAGSWKEPCYAGERVPSLTQFLLQLNSSPAKAVIEIKMPGIAKKVLKLIHASGMAERTVIISVAPIIKEVMDIDPNMVCGMLEGEPKEWKDMTLDAKIEFFTSHLADCKAAFLDAQSSMLSDQLVAELRCRGITVWAWTVDDPKRAQQLYDWGVASVTTNRPDLLQQNPPDSSPPSCQSSAK